jgi:hypothetical protein
MDSFVVVAEGGIGWLREVGRALERAGIASRMVAPPPEHCSS